ncbi:hypothetical protein SPRG_11239 [Saprolegnia parasitica CBS 223.65]|uniref:Uncharacterized protein n=1 Tax=Saprolegnia parasitica (strain CBS 223.65) TaxID=695850 RepID=A0A067CAH3_SAPPC|nr:hypothetical protein SPRG_11239 [Saprolegnia parasitica CBS 223.65]KDO23807.1 hypothetical protein SPRG_11239 [Saprolegnia parasitica CBS 223.65]|eukprot:XP_012205442.1 hypothetical protein SPRG_11239 [Saprolegnia parasitica CBS 223.65]
MRRALVFFSATVAALRPRALTSEKDMMPFVNNASASAAMDVGHNVLRTITTLRGGDPAFYASLYTALQITYCDYLSNTDHHAPGDEPLATWPSSMHSEMAVPPYYRFVASSHPNALVDENGDCLRLVSPPAAVATQYERGYCEVIANCYWSTLQFDDAHDRVPVYATNQAAAPPSDAMTLPQATATLQKWAQSAAYFVAPPIILGVLCFLGCLFFLLCRCCCNRCGGRNAKPSGYSRMERGVPIAFFLVFAGAIAGVAIASLLYYNVITNEIGSLFTTTVTTISGLVSWVHSIAAPLVHLRDTVVNSADAISVKLNNSDFIADGLNGLVHRLEAFENQTYNVVLPRGCVVGTDLICIPCDVCTSINVQVSDAVSQMESAAGSGIATLQSTRSSLLSLLVNSKDTIKSTVNNVVVGVGLLSDMAGNATLHVDTYSNTWQHQSLARQAGILVLFVFSIVVIAVGVIGICFGLTPLRCLAIILHIAYLLGFITLLLTFIISAVFIAVSILMGDVCQLTLLVAQDWTPILGHSSGRGLNACFQNQSLIDAMGLQSSLAFANNLTIPSLNLSSMLQFTSLDAFAETILATNTSTFQVDPTLLPTFLSVLNNFTSQSYIASTQTAAVAATCDVNDGNFALQNPTTPWLLHGSTALTDPVEDVASMYLPYRNPCAGVLHPVCGHNTLCPYDGFLVEIVSNMSALVRVTADAKTFVDDMHVSMLQLENATSTFSGQVTNLSSTLNEIREVLQASLISDVRAFEKSMNCTFVARDYNRFYVALCGTVTPALLMISLCLFLLGLF